MSKLLTNLLNRGTQLAADQQRDLGIAYHASLAAMLRGRGTEQAWSTLACALNISMLLCEAGISAPALQTIKLAQDALLRSRERAQRTDKWALDGEGIHILRVALLIHDEQMSYATRDQIIRAIAEVHKRVAQGEVFSKPEAAPSAA